MNRLDRDELLLTDQRRMGTLVGDHPAVSLPLALDLTKPRDAVDRIDGRHRAGHRRAESGPLSAGAAVGRRTCRRRYVPVRFDAAGAADAVHTALDRAGPGATVILVGLSPAPLPLTASELVRRQLTLRGSLIYDHPADSPDTIAALARREFDPAQVVVQPGFRPDRANEAFGGALQVPGKPWLDLSPWWH